MPALTPPRCADRRRATRRVQAEDNKTLTVSSSSAAVAGSTSDVTLDIETVRARLKGEIEVETRKKDGLEKMLKVAGPKEKSAWPARLLATRRAATRALTRPLDNRACAHSACPPQSPRRTSCRAC